MLGAIKGVMPQKGAPIRSKVSRQDRLTKRTRQIRLVRATETDPELVEPDQNGADSE